MLFLSKSLYLPVHQLDCMTMNVFRIFTKPKSSRLFPQFSRISLHVHHERQFSLAGKDVAHTFKFCFLDICFSAYSCGKYSFQFFLLLQIVCFLQKLIKLTHNAEHFCKTKKESKLQANKIHAVVDDWNIQWKGSLPIRLDKCLGI